MENDEEDPVVEEIPVFLSKALCESLYLFQYPTKKKLENFDASEVASCKVKPVSEEVQIEFALKTDSEHFDRVKAEQFAIASDGKNHGKNDQLTFKDGVMDKQIYTSTKSIEDPSKYLVGILKDNEVHLTPLKGILQLRPSFPHFDKEDKRAKDEQKAEDDEIEEEAKQVTVKCSRGDTEKLNKAREKTYEHMTEKSKEEPWCEVLWHDESSPFSELQRQKLISTRKEMTSDVFNLSSKEYLEKLFPPEKSDENLATILSSKVISRMKLRTLPLKEQLQVLLKDAKMLKFVEIMSILEKDDKSITAEKVLRTIPLVGILIRGNWVLQSEILYPPNSISNSNGVAAELMIRGRDYILYKFSKQEYLDRPKVAITTQLPHDEVYEILQSVARVNAERKWELLLPPDTFFEARYPGLVERQEMMWRRKEKVFNEMEYEKLPKRSRKRYVKS